MAHDWNSSTWGLRQEDGTFGSSLGYSDPGGLSSHDFVILVLGCSCWFLPRALRCVEAVACCSGLSAPNSPSLSSSLLSLPAFRPDVPRVLSQEEGAQCWIQTD